MEKEGKLDWIYKGANSLVDREEYLLGRKVDKTLDQLDEEEKEKKFVLPTPKNHVEHECIPPSIRDFNKIVQAEQVDLSAKLQEDPLVAIKKREEEARRQFLQNPVQLKKLQDALKSQEEKKQKKSKKKRSNSDLDDKIKEKLKHLKQNSLGSGLSKKKKTKEGVLDTILMHKFNALKDKLSEDDIKDILNGKVDSSDEDKPKKKKERKKSTSSESEDDTVRRREWKKSGSGEEKSKQKKPRQKSSSSESEEETARREWKRSDSREGDKRRSSLDRTMKISRSRDKRKFLEERAHKEINSEDEERNDRRGGKRGQEFERSERDRSRSKEKGNRQERSKSRAELIEKRVQRSVSSEDEKRRSKKSRSKERQKQKKRYLRNNSNSSEDEKGHNRVDRNNPEKRKNEQKDCLEDEKKYRNKNKDGREVEEDSADGDLNEKIMAKLRILRGQVELERSKKIMLPEKPKHLKNYNESDSSSSYSDSKQEQQKPKAFGLVTSEGKKIALKGTEERKVEVTTAKKLEVYSKPERKQVKKLTEEQKEILRKEMMRDAKVRDKEREHNVKRYRERVKNEEEMVTKRFNADLVHNELLKSAKHTTVEQRIRSNLNNIQRSSRHMDSNFSKR